MNKSLALHALGWSAAAAALLATFALYHRPEFLVSLADQLWACF
ncbi:hypothetical protein [Hydrogenophaga sp.]|nr:hypothetical protein [Hydrogenophaga sp.]MDO9434823.1 hypothetical protein [Hydrogenophaga sp.]